MLNKTVPLQYSSACISFLMIVKVTIALQYTEFHCFVCMSLHTLALLLYLSINSGAHLCLCLPFYTCGYEADQAYLHPSFTAIQIISLPPLPQAWLVACSFFLPPAGSHSIPQAFPAISSSLSCIAHHWTTAGAEHFITAACREKQTQTRGWAEGLRGALLVWDIPKANRLSSELFGVYVFDLRVLTYCLVTRMQISLIISYLNRHAVPFSNFSLRQYLQLTVSRSGFNGNLSKDVSLRKMLSWDGGEWWEETVLMSTLPRLEVFCSFSGTSITSLIARCGKNSCSEVSAISG